SPTLAQGLAQSRNQETADRVAQTLRSTASLAGSHIEIETRDGVATLTGTVANAGLKAEAVTRTLQVQGVRSVVDQIRLASDTRVQLAQYVGDTSVAPPTVSGPIVNGSTVSGPIVSDAPTVSGPVEGSVASPTAPSGSMYSGPIPEGAAGAGPTSLSTPN